MSRKRIVGLLSLWIDNYCGKLSRYFDLVVCSSEREWMWLVVSARRFKSWYWENNSFPAGVLQWWHYRAWTWPPRSPDLTPPDLFLWGFLKESTAMTKETWRTVNTTHSRLYKHWTVPSLQSWKSHLEECECLCCRKWGHFYRLLWLRIVCHILGFLAQDRQYTYTVCPLNNETAFITKKRMF